MKQLGNSIFKFSNWLIITLAISSCEKVVTIDLNSVNPKLVVEGNITNLPGPYIVKLSHTVNYYDPNVFPVVSGASVFVSDNAGNADTLKETSPGTYRTSSLIGTEGRKYFLKIVASGQTYIALSTMPYKVPIDSLNYFLNTQNNSYRVVCKFKDPAGIANYYKVQFTSNDSLAINSDARLLSDKLTDGEEMSITRNRVHVLVNDTIFAKLESINRLTYDFYTTMVNVEGGTSQYLSAPPANPVTNISNGGLGYFAAYTISRNTVVIH